MSINPNVNDPDNYEGAEVQVIVTHRGHRADITVQVGSRRREDGSIFKISDAIEEAGKHAVSVVGSACGYEVEA